MKPRPLALIALLIFALLLDGLNMTAAGVAALAARPAERHSNPHQNSDPYLYPHQNTRRRR